MTGVNLETIKLILIYLLRSDKLMGLAAGKLRTDHFRPGGWERGYAVLWEILSRYYATYRRRPDRHVVEHEFNSFLSANPAYLMGEQIEGCRTILVNAYNPHFDKVDEHTWEYGRVLLSRFLVERNVIDKLRLGLQGGGSAEDVVRDAHKAMAGSQLSAHTTVRPFDVCIDEPLAQRQRTGAEWFDHLVHSGDATRGGLYVDGGDLVGFIAPVGNGKTLAAIHLATRMALRSRHIRFVTTEQPVEGEMRIRMLLRLQACATGIPTLRLQGGRVNLTAEERQRYDQVRDQIDTHFGVIDASGIHSQRNNVCGMDEIEVMLMEEASRGIRVELVVIDWFGPILRQLIAKDGGYGKKDARHYTVEETKKALRLAATYKTNFFITHQSSTEAIKRPISGQPMVTDAEDAKNFGHLMQFCFSMTRQDEESHIARLSSVKAREAGRRGTINVKIDGQLQQIEIRDDMVLDPRNRRGGFVKEGDEDEVVDRPRGFRSA